MVADVGRGSCFRALSKVYSYLDGEVRAVRKVRIRLHLRKCISCERAYQFEQRLLRFIRERARVEAPPEVIERIRRSIRDFTHR